MKTVLVTGSSGFIGKNVCVQLEQQNDIKLLRFKRGDSSAKLAELVVKADFIFHLAGINRPRTEAEFHTGNTRLTESIIETLEKSGRKTPLLLASSTQAKLDNSYGKSKRAAEQAVLVWAKKTGSKAYVYRLPGVFGKWCKPNYNSVVATFCYNITHGLDVTINDPSTKLNLVYIDDVVNDFMNALAAKKKPARDGFCHIPRGFSITLGKLADKLYGFKNIRQSLLVPSLKDDLDKFLFATYLSYLDVNDFGYKLDTKSDQRGWLAEFIKSEHAGQIFVSQTKPGFSRGNHWHHTKIEKFLVVTGRAEVAFKHLVSGDVISYEVSGEELRVIDMPVGYVHSIRNIGDEDLITLIWADEIFDPERPDTYYLEV